MKIKRVSILGVPFININRVNFIKLLNERIEKNEKTFVVTANPETVMKANEDSSYMKDIRNATYVTADGIGIVKAAQLLNEPLPERVTGFDTMIDLLELADKKHYKVYLLGAKQEVLETAVKKIKDGYPGINLVGYHNGFFDWKSEDISNEIQVLQPDLTFIALGVPRQEQWISQNLEKFPKGIFMGVGGSIDVLAGAVNRAPEIWQKLNLEWFYRLVKQPSRFIRMLALPQFAFKILGQKVKGTK